eukprot:m.5950 g.5950  ORF g.5950 m.5950 type:complete len:173 (-) comp5728_c0_seq1:21-539(-)
MALSSFSRWFFFVFFVIHIPITLLVDLQAIGRHFYPPELTAANSWYVNEFHDPYMEAANPPAWFTSFIFCELFFQLPFFFFAVYAFWAGDNRLKIPGIAYGCHVATTVVAISADLLFTDFEGTVGPKTLEQRLKLLAIYSPFFLVPIWMAFELMLVDQPFATGEEKKKKKTK